MKQFLSMRTSYPYSLPDHWEFIMDCDDIESALLIIQDHSGAKISVEDFETPLPGFVYDRLNEKIYAGNVSNFSPVEVDDKYLYKLRQAFRIVE